MPSRLTRSSIQNSILLLLFCGPFWINTSRSEGRLELLGSFSIPRSITTPIKGAERFVSLASGMSRYGGDKESFILVSDGDIDSPPLLAHGRLAKDALQITGTSTLRSSNENCSDIINPEGIACRDDRCWLAEEEGPAFLKYSLKERKILWCSSSENNVLAFLAKGRKNRGFEGVALLPTDEVVVTMQSPLKESSGWDQRLVPAILYNESTENTSLLAFPVPEELRGGEAIKISDATYYDGRAVLLLLQGEDQKNGERRVWLMKANIPTVLTANKTSEVTPSKKGGKRKIKSSTIILPTVVALERFEDIGSIVPDIKKPEALSWDRGERTLYVAEDFDPKASNTGHGRVFKIKVH